MLQVGPESGGFWPPTSQIAGINSRNFERTSCVPKSSQNLRWQPDITWRQTTINCTKWIWDDVSGKFPPKCCLWTRRRYVVLKAGMELKAEAVRYALLMLTCSEWIRFFELTDALPRQIHPMPSSILMTDVLSTLGSVEDGSACRTRYTKAWANSSRKSRVLQAFNFTASGMQKVSMQMKLGFQDKM